MARKQSSTIYYRGNKHKEIFYQGHYHDKMYLGGQLIWEKLKSASVIVSKFYSFIEDKDITYCLVQMQCRDWEDSSKERWYISVYDILHNRIIPIINVTSNLDNNYSHDVELKFAANGKFLLYIRRYLGKEEIWYKSAMIDSETKNLIYTDDKIPDFPCVFFSGDKKESRVWMFADGNNYYTHKLVDATGDTTGIEVKRCFLQKRDFDGNIVGEVLLNKGSQASFAISFMINGYVYAVGFTHSDPSSIYSDTIYNIFPYGESKPIVSVSKDTYIYRDAIGSYAYNQGYYLSENIAYMIGYGWTKNSITQMYIYMFDGSTIQELASFSDSDFNRPNRRIYGVGSIKKIGQSIIAYANYTGLDSTSNDFLKIGVYKNGELKTIDIAPLRNITQFCGVFGNEEYICAAVNLRYMYNELPWGMYIVRISQETLEIVDFINPTIDEKKL